MRNTAQNLRRLELFIFFFMSSFFSRHSPPSGQGGRNEYFSPSTIRPFRQAQAKAPLRPPSILRSVITKNHQIAHSARGPSGRPKR